jgi:hypothetical protein
MPEKEPASENVAPTQPSIKIEPSATQLVNVTKIHQNLSQEVIMITEDKARLVLSEHLKKMDIRRDWVAPLGIFLAITITFSTSTFKDAILDSATWRALFILVGALSFLWLLWAVYRALKAEKIEDVVEQLKRSTT